MPPLKTPPTYVAEIDGEVVGCASIFYAADGFGWLANVAVKKGLRRQGLGKRLVRACIQRGHDRQLPAIWLTTMFWNRRFYEGLGFQFIPSADVGATVRGYRQSQNTMFMRLLLTPGIRKPPAAQRPGALMRVEAY